MPRLFVCVFVTTLIHPAAAWAQSESSSSVEEEQLHRGDDRWDSDLFARGVWRTQFTGTFLSEAWDFNGARESLYGGALAYNYGFAAGWTLGAEAGVLRMQQEQASDVVVSTLSLIIRRRLRHLGPLSLFVEGGPGLSYGNRAVPDGGTRFNFVAQSGVGTTIRVGLRSNVVSGLRWLHLSNNGMRGRRRNPDVQAVGGYLGFAVF